MWVIPLGLMCLYIIYSDSVLLGRYLDDLARMALVKIIINIGNGNSEIKIIIGGLLWIALDIFADIF